MWMILLLACGGTQQSETCAAMLSCDVSWSASDPGRDTRWGGEADETYGAKGGCWSDEDAAGLCTEACALELQGYKEEIAVLVDFGDLGGVPTGCE